MSNIPEDLKYTKDHEWVRVDGSSAIIGVTDFAQRELGELVYIECPEVGQNFEQGGAIGSLESVKAVSELFMPIKGEILEVNGEVSDSPELVNDDPYGEGWLVKISIKDATQLKGLLSADEYKAYIADEENG